MAGFVTAAALVRPSKSVLDLEARSVVKRMKDKAFARAVKREDLRAGAEELGLPLDEHIANVIAFMRRARRRARACGARCEARRPTAPATPDSGTSACVVHEPYTHRMADIDRSSTLDAVTVAYGRNAALRDVTASFAARRGRAARAERRGQEHDDQGAARLHRARRAAAMRVLGLDVAAAPLEIRARLGYMPETDAHIPGMNAVTFVAYCGELAGLPRVDAMQRAHEVLYYVGLGEARYRNVETYSTGMKQRIKLAQALVHDPDLLFLDEPTNGMDPKGRDEMLELDPRPRAQQGRQPDPLVAPAAGRRAHLRPRRRAGQGARRHAGADRDAEAAARAGVRAARQGADREVEPFLDAAARRRPRVPRDRRGRDARVRARRAGRTRRCSRSRPPRACRCGICARASRRSRTCSRTPWERRERGVDAARRHSAT